MSMWIDTHCHLDATEFGLDPAQGEAERERARRVGVLRCVIPAVERANWDAVRVLAHRFGDAYALGIHPLYVPGAVDDDLAALDVALSALRHDPRLVAVGEIGLDFFVPALCTPDMRERQQFFYREQLRLAHRHGLPVILHVRRSADVLVKYLRAAATAGRPLSGGIVHAFNGSAQQAGAFVDLGFKLGFGGAFTFDAALQLRRLASVLPLDVLVLETDAPDIPPQWLYVPSQRREQGERQAPNTPAELPRIGAELAALRGMSAEALARATCANAYSALPRLTQLP